MSKTIADAIPLTKEKRKSIIVNLLINHRYSNSTLEEIFEETGVPNASIKDVVSIYEELMNAEERITMSKQEEL